VNQVFSAALIGGLIGTFVGGFTKFLWERLVPDWMTWRRTQEVAREHQMATIRAPAYLAFSELQGRLRSIANKLAKTNEQPKNIATDDYYVRSTAYMLGRAFAWQVILQERMARYDYAALYRCLEDVTQALVKGEPSAFQIFHMEQREIGERMLTRPSEDNAKCVLYSEFLDRMAQEESQRWMESLTQRATAVFEHTYEELDRLEQIDKALTKTLNLIDPKKDFMYPIALQAKPIDAKAIRLVADA
jgi:hypothetical protein